MSKHPPIDQTVTEAELHAFIDGELVSDRAHVVKAAIQADPALADLVAAYQADKLFMKRLYGPLIDQPVPQHLIDLARARGSSDVGVARPGSRWWIYGAVAAMLALLVTGTGLLTQLPGGDVVRQALDARKQTLALAEDIGRYNEDLSRIVDAKVKVPDLSRAGYQLVGVGIEDDAATIAYRDGRGGLFTIYLRSSDGTVRFDQFRQADLRICVWQDDRVSMVMAGEMSAAIMQKLASLAYVGLTT